MITAQYLHDACHEAMCECPQFRGYDYDSHFQGWGMFGEIPKKGLYKTYRFWQNYGDLLWDKGYDECLPQDVQEFFRDVDKVIADALKKHFGS